MSGAEGGPAPTGPLLAPGPTFSFGFNLPKVPDQGEDSDPIVRDGPDLALTAVFDGMGGAGGTTYETAEGRRTGAYLASRIARDVVEDRMLDLLEPYWNLKGQAAAEDLRRSLRQALADRLEELKAPPSGLRSRLLRALPTTMAVLALQRSQPGGASWTGHVFWAGDSRGYVFDPRSGAQQLTSDDLRDPGDALANLRRDSVVSNALSADTDFHVSYRRVELRAPFLALCATDGCFGYLPTPMHFEHLVLATLASARSASAWSAAMQAEIAAVTGDDAAMSVIGVGATLKEFQQLFAPRVAELEAQFITPLDELSSAVAQAERDLAALRQRQQGTTADVWLRYQPGYEHYLRPEPPGEDAEDAEDAEDSASPKNGRDAAATPAEESAAPDSADEASPSAPAEPATAQEATP